MALLKYALARVVVLLAVAGVLYLAGARSWLLWLGALLLAALVSYLALPGIRDDAARVIAHRDHGRERVNEDDAEEDRLLDEQESTADSESGAAVSDTARPDDDASPAVTASPSEVVEPAGEPLADAEASTAVSADEPEDEPRGASSLENVPEALADSPTHHRDDSEERGKGSS
ncbi:hypothetical protein CZ771_06985 [Actinomycetales bacterium JB111]|nr:hypothetical protein CZ771_06985 [Actinomycetales bacterium JB111]